MFEKIISCCLLLFTVTSADAECVAKPIDLSPAMLVNKDTASAKDFNVKVQESGKKNELFYTIQLSFPKKYNDTYSYAYSKALYSKNGKRLLAYRPTPIASPKPTHVEYAIVASAEVLSCLSLVNVYTHNTIKGECAPSLSLTIDLASFITTGSKCTKLHADNYY